MNDARSLRFHESLVNVSRFPVTLQDGDLVAADSALVDAVIERVGGKAGFAILHSTNALLRAHGLDVRDAAGAEVARRYLEAIFRAAVAHLDLAKYSPVAVGYDRITKMDVDGYNRNKNFTPNGEHTESREFVTTKCVHFDAATPFIANLYGPNENIRGGAPIICDTRTFCLDKGIDPKTLVENIPNNYNVAVKSQYCEEILREYSYAFDVDLENDVVAVVIFNEVVGGVAHAATPPRRADEGRPARRPIRHVELQVATTEDLKIWYDFYGLGLKKATDHKEDVSSPRYHSGETTPHLIQVSREGA
jgi:hypothetical protein